jgi:hypothetical protein
VRVAPWRARNSGTLNSAAYPKHCYSLTFVGLPGLIEPMYSAREVYMAGCGKSWVPGRPLDVAEQTKARNEDRSTGFKMLRRSSLYCTSC